MGDTAPIGDWIAVGVIIIILVTAIAVAIMVGPEPDKDAEREWQDFLELHPDAPALLEADWQRRVAEAEREHKPIPPPVPH